MNIQPEHHSTTKSEPLDENQFLATFNQAAVGMAHIGLDGSWLRVNQKICDIVGYSKEELMKLTFQDITYPEDLNSDLNLLSQLVDGRIKNYSLEKRYICKDEALSWINLTVSAVRDTSFKPIYFISVIEDINQRKKTETELQKIKIELEERVEQRTRSLSMVNEALQALIKRTEKTEIRLNRFFQLSSDIMIITDCDRNVLQVNEAFHRILGYSAEDVVGRQVIDYVYQDDYPESEAMRSSITNRQQVTNFENRMLAKNGSMVWFSWSYVMLREENSIFCIARDITAIKAQEKQISEQKLKIANVSKMNSLNRMAAGIAHEVNNPMMVIYGQVYLLKKYVNLQAKPSKYILDGLAKIDLVAQRVKSIVNGLRSFSRDAGKDPYEPVKLSNIIDDTLMFCHSEIAKNNIALTVEPAVESQMVYCRPVQMCQVLLNLIENSIDSLSESLIKNKWIRIHYAPTLDHRFILLMVTDSGSGIDAQTKENLFQPFFTTKPIGKGTGLGLSISKSIMEANEGHLYLLDNSNDGTTFVMKLPLKSL
ncbi:MAG: PAS domain S-box protein [Bdellovibrionaceae bacterium]|nr:PAS domain S-box protein [Pseudobdellovibrionaceae bacterium]